MLLLTSVTKKFMTSLFMSSFDTLTWPSFDSHASVLMVFLLAVGGMLTGLLHWGPVCACEPGLP